MKKLGLTVIAAITMIGGAAFLILINDVAISVRLNELKIYLQELDNREASIDHIGLIATYEINKKMYEKRLSQESADAIEQGIHSLILREKDYPVVIPARYPIISIPAVWVINFNRNILGKKPLNYRRGQDYDLVDLDIAYYLERNFLFKRAIAQYEKALKRRNINTNLKASMLLHQGYCYALAGMNDKAQNNYRTIIKEYNQESSAITATILLKYLEGFTIARDKVLHSGADPLLRSQDLVKLLAYEQALDILDTLEFTAKPEDLTLIRYYKARCFTGLGKSEKAVETYIGIITASPASQYARLSNRKLFMIGSRAGGDNEVLKISIRMNGQLKDPVLSDMIQQLDNASAPVQETFKLQDLEIPERILKKAEQFSRDAPRSAVTVKLIVIETSDGNTFKGAVIEETKEYIALKTSIGRINVKRNKITRISAQQ